jgi:hypothetical protein
MAADTRPWLDYSGQTTGEVLACKETHSVGSLLCALEEGIQLRQSRQGKKGTTREERILLGVMALDREVNNGGYDQFFTNSSRQFVPTIVRSLKRIACDRTAELTAQAIAEKEDTQVLDTLDAQFYTLTEIETNLFELVEANPDKFLLEKVTLPPRPVQRGNVTIIKIATRLEYSPKENHSVELVRSMAVEIAAELKLIASAADIDGSVYRYLMLWYLRKGTLEEVEPFAWKAFELAREDTTQCVLHREWAEKLIASGNEVLADEATVRYLEYLKTDDATQAFVRNRITFWRDLIVQHPAAIPRAARFFAETFPEFA